MEAKKKNPLLAGLLSLIPQAVSTISSIVKDKREKKEAAKLDPATTGEAIADSVKEMVSGSISSKRLLNVGGFGLIITIAMTDIGAHGITKQNLALIAIGVAYSICMSVITWLSERK